MSAVGLDRIVEHILGNKEFYGLTDQHPVAITSDDVLDTVVSDAYKHTMFFWNTCCGYQGSYVKKHLIDNHEDRKDSG